MFSFGSQHPGALVLHNFPTTLMDITKPDGVRIDLATIDVMRDREREVPRYNHFRRSINLEAFSSIDEITRDPVSLVAKKNKGQTHTLFTQTFTRL